MELIPLDYTNNYQAYKAELDTEINKAAEGFVKIGYLLKVARDTKVLEESGYTTVAEFAAKEYGLSKDVVSRYMAINDRFSENGYSPYLSEQYRSYGSAKLQEMLTLPDNILEHISADTTKSEIIQIKKEYAEEQTISDIEVAIEAAEHQIQVNEHEATDIAPTNNMERLIYDYLHGEPEEYSRLFNLAPEDFYEQLVPTGTKTIIGRVPGVGKLIMSIKDVEADIVISNMRDIFFKETYKWSNLVAYLQLLCLGKDVKVSWQCVYGEEYPVKEQTLPKQQSKPVSEPVKSKQKPEDKKKIKKSKISIIKKPKKKNTPNKSVIDKVETVSKKETATVIEVVHGVNAEIVDLEKVSKEVISEQMKAEIEVIPTHTKEPEEEVAPVQQETSINISKKKAEEVFQTYYNAMDSNYQACKKELRNHMKLTAVEFMKNVQETFNKILSLPIWNDVNEEEE